MLEDEGLSDLLEITKCQLEKIMLSLVFQEVPLKEIEMLGVTCLQALNTQKMEVDESRCVLAREVEPSPGSTNVHKSFCHKVAMLDAGRIRT